MGLEPVYTISSEIARNLMRIESARQAVDSLPLNERVLAGLRQKNNGFWNLYSHK